MTTRRRSLRSDSSASTLQTTPVSPLPSSLDARPRSSSQLSDVFAFAMSKTSGTNGTAKGTEASSSAAAAGEGSATSSPRQDRHTMPGRARSASFQKGVAVLRALARASEDEVDSGYEDEGREAQVDSMPGPLTGTNGSAHNGQANGDEVLSEEAKASGRQNREGLRQRRENKEVARIVGGKSVSNTREKRKAKSWEIPRKVFHSSMGFWVLTLYVSKTELNAVVRTMSIMLGVVVTADVIRLNVPSFEWLYEKVLGFLMRESEKKKVNGVVWYLIGVLFCLHALPEDVACVSVMILSWADTAASVFGRLFGQYTPPLPSPPFAARKSLAGTIAASFVAMLTAAVFWATPIAEYGRRQTLATDGPNAIPVSLLCIGSGIVGGIAEGLELGGVDDNLSLPILSGLGIKAVLWAWNYFFP